MLAASSASPRRTCSRATVANACTPVIPRPPGCASTHRAVASAARQSPAASSVVACNPRRYMQRPQDLPRLEVGDALVDPAPRALPITAHHGSQARPWYAIAGIEGVPGLAGLVEAAPQRGLVRVQHRAHHADPAVHVDEHGEVADLLGQGDGARHGAFGLLPLPPVEADAHGQVAVGHREIRARRLDLEHLQRRRQPAFHVLPPAAQQGQ